MAGETMNPAECGLKEQKQKRYVDINPAIEFLEGYDNSWGQEFADGVRTALHFIKKLPAADVQEVKHAHWVIIEYEYLNCSNCASSYFTGAESREQARKWLEKGYAYSYCPWCGAKMDEEDGK